MESPGGNVFSQVEILPNGKTFVCYHISLLAVKVTQTLSQDPCRQPSNISYVQGEGLASVKNESWSRLGTDNYGSHIPFK